MTRLIALMGLVVSVAASAGAWNFGPPIDVVPVGGKSVFQHLDAGDRKHVAVADGTIAVTWEDNHSGTPGIYVATKRITGESFSAPQLVSGKGEAFEPVVAALGNGQFILGWEEGDAVWVRVLSNGTLHAGLKIADRSSQISLAAAGPNRAVAVWAHRQEKFPHIYFANLTVDKNGQVKLGLPKVVDPSPPDAEQQFPSVIALGEMLTVAWEDRRRGHTVLFYSHAKDGKRFAMPKDLNEVPPKRSAVYGKGTGVMRVSLTRLGERGVAAVWLDKRELAVGYDVYAAISQDGGASFAKNEKVQDEFGNNIRQWHAAIAGNRKGQLAAAWDDDREGNSDIFISWRDAQGWSDDLVVPGASGPGVQEAPAIAVDESGNLHLIWLDRSEPNAPTRLRYLFGRIGS